MLKQNEQEYQWNFTSVLYIISIDIFYKKKTGIMTG